MVSAFMKSNSGKAARRPKEYTEPKIQENFLARRGHADPDETRLKFLMCNEIAVLMDNRDLTQAKVAELAGVAQPDVSRIVNGNVKDFSVWRLMRVLNSLGKDITVEFSNAVDDRGQVFTRFNETEPETDISPSQAP